MLCPSGDQAGSRSITPGVLVISRVLLSFAGTVRMSPCASKTARTPVGEMPELWISRFGRRNTRAHIRQVRAHVHADLVCFAARRVVEKEFAETVVNDSARSSAGRTNIRAAILHHFGYRFCRRVKAKQRYGPITIGKKIDLFVHPDGIEVVGTFPRDLHHVQRGHVCNPYRACQSAAV